MQLPFGTNFTISYAKSDSISILLNFFVFETDSLGSIKQSYAQGSCHSFRLPRTDDAWMLACDGAEGAYLQCYFSQLSSTSSALLGPWKPYPGGIDHAFRPSLGPSRQNKYRPAATVQLLTKKRSIFLL